MTLQETFDTVARHLLTQNAKSRGFSAAGNPSCMYRGEEGRKCAVGVLIKDEFYSPTLENCVAREDNVIEALEKSGVNMDSIDVRDLLNRAQNIHDRFDSYSWRRELSFLATRFNLNTDALS